MSESTHLFYPLKLEFEARDLHETAAAVAAEIATYRPDLARGRLDDLRLRADDLLWECDQEIARVRALIADGASTGSMEPEQFTRRLNEAERAIATLKSVKDILSAQRTNSDEA